MRSVGRLIAPAVFVLLLSAGSALGCSCAGGGSPCQAFGGASAVFVGTATGVSTRERTSVAEARRAADAGEDDYAPRVFRFAVEQAFLGVEGTEVEVGTGAGGGDCGYGFERGVSYLVYAYRHSKSKRLTTSICSRTTPTAGAGEDLEYLRTLPSLAPGVTIHGEVRRRLRDAARGGAQTSGPVPDASLVVEGEGERREARADAAGRYRLAGLRPGKYKVKLLLPDELTTHRAEQEVAVADRGCAVVDYFVTDNGRVGGRVLDAEGHPAAGVLLALVGADDTDQTERNYNWLERTDEQGRYGFSAVPPGRYLLGLQIVGSFSQPDDPTNAYPRTYYPGVADASEAEVLTLGAGANLRERDLRLPPRRAASAVRGQVVWADGSPVAGASVRYREEFHGGRAINFSVSADEQGRFTIKAYEGQTFVVEASSNRPYVGDPSRLEPMERADPLRLTVTDPQAPVRLVITKLR